MMSRTQILLESETHRRARRRASDLGVSLAEYVRRLVARDVAATLPRADVASVFDLGRSSGSDIARHKDSMVGEAFHAASHKPRRA